MPVPTSLALASIADGSSIIASDHRNNYAAIQTAVNALIGFFAAGAAGATLRYDGTNWAKTANIILDDTNSKITLGGDANLSRNPLSVLLANGTNYSIFAIGSNTMGTIANTNVGLGLANSGGAVASPTGGGFLYVASGALHYKGSSGTDTVVAAA